MNSVWLTVLVSTTVLSAPLVTLAQVADTAVPAIAVESTTAMHNQLFEQINQLRLQEGLVPLQANDHLDQAAYLKSQQLAGQGHLSRTKTLKQFIQEAGVDGVIFRAENLYRSSGLQNSAELVVDTWMNHPGTRANLLNPDVTETGIGIYRHDQSDYVTQFYIQR